MKPINTFIIWLLLLCLPMQAMAALAMMSSPAMSAAHSYSSPADDHCPPQAQADDGACACSAMCALAAALAPAGLNAAFYRPAASGPIPYLGAYAGTFFPDGLERPPPHAPS